MAVTQGISEHISNHFQDESASFMISTSLSPMEECVIPFTIGDLDPQKSFVHIIDDYTLENMFSELDTPKDLFQYLDKKEELFRSDSRLIIPGEEELIADYVTNIDHSTGMHSFSFLHKLDPYGNLFRDCERWKSMKENEQYLAKKSADKISYDWDCLIERIGKNALNGTQYHHKGLPNPSFNNSEEIARKLANNSRFERRTLASAFLGIIHKSHDTPKDVLRRILPLNDSFSICYIFITFPENENWTYEKYVEIRFNYLNEFCYAVKYKHPETTEIIGVITESGDKEEGVRSEDAVYIDTSIWNDGNYRRGAEIIEKYNFFNNTKEVHFHSKEYPDLE